MFFFPSHALSCLFSVTELSSKNHMDPGALAAIFSPLLLKKTESTTVDEKWAAVAGPWDHLGLPFFKWAHLFSRLLTLLHLPTHPPLRSGTNDCLGGLYFFAGPRTKYHGYSAA